MAHPDLRIVREAFEEGIFLFKCFQVGPAIFSGTCRLNFSSTGMSHELCSIAYSENRIFATDTVQVHLESFRVIDAVGRTGKDDTYN